MVEKASDGIAILQDAKIKFLNPRLAKMWGGAIDELLDRPITDFLPPGEIPKVLGRYKKRMAGEKIPAIYETILLRKDGSNLNVELNAGISQYKGQKVDQVFVHDITERKQAQTWRKVLEESIEAIAMTLEMRDPTRPDINSALHGWPVRSQRKWTYRSYRSMDSASPASSTTSER